MEAADATEVGQPALRTAGLSGRYGRWGVVVDAEGSLWLRAVEEPARANVSLDGAFRLIPFRDATFELEGRLDVRACFEADGTAVLPGVNRPASRMILLDSGGGRRVIPRNRSDS